MTALYDTHFLIAPRILFNAAWITAFLCASGFLTPWIARCGADEATNAPTREAVLLRLREKPPEKNIVSFSITPNIEVSLWLDDTLHDLMFLAKLDASVDADLEQLTSSDQPIYVRYRGMVSLIMRGTEKGLRLAAEWLQSKSETQRYAGWLALQYCSNRDLVWKFVEPDMALQLYSAEKSALIRGKIEAAFSQFKADFAVEALCRSILRGANENKSSAIGALGGIGDPRAIDPLIRCGAPSSWIVEALGRIGDLRGADFVIAHLNDPGAPLALAKIGGDKAIPALERASKRMKTTSVTSKQQSPNEQVRRRDQLAVTEMAIMLLKSKSPQAKLLDVIEDPMNSISLRQTALQELARVGLSCEEARFLEFYRSAMPTTLGTNCIYVAARNPSVEITNSMKEHLLVLSHLDAESQSAKSEIDLAGKQLLFSYLVLFDALHRRIGNEVFSVQDRPLSLPKTPSG